MDNFEIVKVEDNILYGCCFLTGKYIEVNLNGY